MGARWFEHPTQRKFSGAMVTQELSSSREEEEVKWRLRNRWEVSFLISSTAGHPEDAKPGCDY